MKTKKTYLLVAFICLCITFCFTTCKKYDEDGKRSWHKPEKRVLGAWYLKEFLVDGADSVNTWYEKKTNDVTDTIKWQLMNTRFRFDDNKKSSEGQTVDIYDEKIYIKYSATQFIGNIHVINNWALKNKNKQINFSSQYEFKRSGVLVVSFSIFGDVSDLWDIKKLTDKEMIIEAYGNNNKHLRLKFQK